MKKKVFDPNDAMWKRGINATPTAVAIEQLTRTLTVPIGKIFAELERQHGMSIRWCWQGIVVERDGDIIYEQGRYARVQAKGRLQCAEQRRYAYMFLRWCATHYPTDTIIQNKAWIYGR